jgi:hypothetical protein
VVILLFEAPKRQAIEETARAVLSVERTLISNPLGAL